MRKPHIASARSLKRSLRKKQIARPRPNRRDTAAPLATPVCRPRRASASARAPRNDNIDVAREPMRYAFGAVRVGALLGRVRLHLQTDRFLAAHRGDALWEEACREAGLALAELVSRMAAGEMDAALAPQHMQKRHASETPQSVIPNSPGANEGSTVAIAANRTDCVTTSRPSERGPGSRKTGTLTLARCSAELERSRP